VVKLVQMVYEKTLGAGEEVKGMAVIGEVALQPVDRVYARRGPQRISSVILPPYYPEIRDFSFEMPVVP